MRKHLVTLILYSPAIIALLLFFLALDFPSAFATIDTSFRYFGLMAGLAGASLFAWNFILASRLRIIEELFLGLNKVYTNHHMVGAIAFILLLFHPVLLALQFLPYGVSGVVQFLQPSLNNLPALYGTLALNIAIIALVITFFVKIKYHLWKLSHKFLGLSLALASLHILAMPSITEENLPLKIFLYALFAAALVSFFTRNLFSDFFVKKFEYYVDKIEPKGSAIFEVFFKPKNQKITYEPGQFFFIKIYGQGIKKEYHPFSIASPQHSNLISFAYKELGDFTIQLQNLKQGDRALIEGPYGKFHPLKLENKQQIWVAGGIGVTPFLSTIRSLPPVHDFNIHFYYSARNSDDAVYLNELKTIEQAHSNITIIPFLQDKDGFLTMKVISEKTADYKKRDIFLCGPPNMMKSLKKQSADINFPEQQIHSEEFALYEGK